MGKNCGSCRSKCDSVVSETLTDKEDKVVTGYVLKDVYTGLYLDIDELATDGEPLYYLHDDRANCYRFSTREEALAELGFVLQDGIDVGDGFSAVGAFLKLKTVKLVKKKRRAV